MRAGALASIALAPPLARQLGVVRRRDKPDTAALRVVLDALAALRAKTRARPLVKRASLV